MIKLVFCHHQDRGCGHYVLPHRHECHELIFYEEAARGVTEIAGMAYEIAPYCISLVRKGLVHGEQHYADTKVFFLGFESEIALSDGVWSDMGALYPLFLDIARELRSQEWGYENVISMRIQEILIRLERKNGRMGSPVRNLEYCRQYIEENYIQSIAVGDLAEMCGYSSDRFRHLFAEKFGMYPQPYLMDTRMRNARRLLQTTEYTCTEIARMCGFSDNSQMTKMMRKRYGMTPKEMRT